MKRLGEILGSSDVLRSPSSGPLEETDRRALADQVKRGDDQAREVFETGATVHVFEAATDGHLVGEVRELPPGAFWVLPTGIASQLLPIDQQRIALGPYPTKARAVEVGEQLYAVFAQYRRLGLFKTPAENLALLESLR